MSGDGAKPPVCRGPVRRALYVIAGSILLAAGVAGIALPLLPTTPFLLAAAFCYGRSSPRCYRWLMTNRLFGRYLDDYMCGRGISWRVKASALAFLWLAISLSAIFIAERWWIRALLGVIALGVTVHVVVLSTHPGDKRRRDREDS